MNKKVWISIVAVLLAVVAGWFLWPTAPEYGDSYSEQQRKLWNERRELLPWIWSLAQGSHSDFLSMVLGEDEGLIQDRLEQKGRVDKCLEEAQMKLCNEAHMSYPAKLDINPDFTSLSAEQVPVRECLRRAQGGDADACLAMAWNLGWGCDESRGKMLSWREAKDVDYWLSKAEELKHPGARFLRHFARLTLPECHKTVRSIVGNGFFCSERICPSYERLPGYENFLDCLRQGDLMAYGLMRRMTWNLVYDDKERSVLMDALGKQVKAGDVRAMEKMIDLVFSYSKCNGNWPWMCRLDMERSFWNTKIQMLPKAMRKPVWNGLLRCGMLDVEDSATMQELRMGLDCARKAARQGSLAGMDCWLWNGLFSLEHFSREDWDEVFRFHRTLMEQGYVPFLHNRISACWEPSTDVSLMDCYYSRSSLRRVIKKTLKQMDWSNAALWRDVTKLTDAEDTDTARQQLDELIAVRGADHILNKLLAEAACWDVSPEIARMYASKVKEMGDEGDPLGKLVLGYCYEKGFGVERDLGKAWKCYVESKDAVGIFVATLSEGYSDLDNGGENVPGNMLETPDFFLLALGVHYADFPGRDEKLMYAIAQELEKRSSPWRRGNEIYLLGRIYEDGIGTPVDRKKALELYESVRVPHAGCSEGCKRLQSSCS